VGSFYGLIFLEGRINSDFFCGDIVVLKIVNYCFMGQRESCVAWFPEVEKFSFWVVNHFTLSDIPPACLIISKARTSVCQTTT
jgi:hypothetical protein